MYTDIQRCQRSWKHLRNWIHGSKQKKDCHLSICCICKIDSNILLYSKYIYIIYHITNPWWLLHTMASQIFVWTYVCVFTQLSYSIHVTNMILFAWINSVSLKWDFVQSVQSFPYMDELFYPDSRIKSTLFRFHSVCVHGEPTTAVIKSYVLFNAYTSVLVPGTCACASHGGVNPRRAQ